MSQITKTANNVNSLPSPNGDLASRRGRPSLGIDTSQLHYGSNLATAVTREREFKLPQSQVQVQNATNVAVTVDDVKAIVALKAIEITLTSIAALLFSTAAIHPK